MNDLARFKSIKQVAASGSGFSEAGLRWLVFNAKSNGLAKAIIRIGRKVLIDVDAFTAWLETHRSDRKT